MPFILDEDQGIKNLVSGLRVSDERNATRTVGVWFGMPDVEVRARSYPFITVDLVGLAEDKTRQMSGRYRHDFAYTPEGFPTKTNSTDIYMSDLPPEAYNLTYQVSSWARNPRHDRQLLGQLLSGPLPLRWGMCAVGTGAAETIRRLDVRMDKRDTADSDGKRLFRNVFTCQMSAELFFWQVQAVAAVSTVVLDIHQTG